MRAFFVFLEVAVCSLLHIGAVYPTAGGVYYVSLDFTCPDNFED